MSVRLRGRGEGNEATSEGPGGVAAAAADKAGDAAAVERFVVQAKAAPARLRLGRAVRHGHGTIRLRGAAPEAVVPEVKAAPARLRLGGVVRHGHGTIRLRGAAPEAVAPEAPPAVDPEPAARHGHGTIRLRSAGPAGRP